MSETKEKRARRQIAPWLLGGLVLSLLALIVAQQAFGLWGMIVPATVFETLLLYVLSSLIFVAFIVFSFIFLRSLFKLRRERREQQLGSKIKTRLVAYFILVSLLPITALAVFSFFFLNRSLEKWFSRLPTDVVAAAHEARFHHAAEQAEETRVMAMLLSAASQTEGNGLSQPPDLARYVEQGQFTALLLLADDGRVLARSEATLDERQREDWQAVLERLRAAPATQAATGENWSGSLHIASVPFGAGRTLIAARAHSPNPHLERIVIGSEAFEELRKRQLRVRWLGLSILGLLTLLVLFATTWLAIHLARGIATPIRALAEASDEVARGNLDYRVTTVAEDELAMLAASFNQMTAQLAENRARLEANAAELREKNLALAERRDYIETVLESLATGVVSLDEQDRITTINAAALAMLRLKEAPATGAALAGILSDEDLAVLERLLRRARRVGRATEQTELARGAAQDGGAAQVAITATALSAAQEGGRGVVLVMEDLSELLAAQRAAAWSEVARRMAHEIKNPLTPIQLSAERIARLFPAAAAVTGGAGANGEQRANGSTREQNSRAIGRDEPARSGGADDAQGERAARVVAEGTATIIREVAGLKGMVDEFSRFARLPHARPAQADLNEIVRQAVTLYEDRLESVRLDVRLAPALPAGMLDAEQLRRVFVNLLDNALEALEGIEGERRITVATGYDPARGLLLAEVADTGHGIAREDFPRLFQPYFSTRGRGTGLGLAIIRRIITDHAGRIRAQANRPRGAKFIIELPAAEETRGHGDAETRRQEDETPAPRYRVAASPRPVQTDG